jgi:hypothetical protein
MRTLVALLLLSGTAFGAETPAANELDFQSALVTNRDTAGAWARNAALVVRYGRQRAPRLSIEGSIGFYQVLNFVFVNDEYEVYPLTASLRYSLPLGDFEPFVYAGATKHFTSASGQGIDQGKSILNPVRPALGVGALYTFADGWALRADAGIDTLGAGLSLRF